MNIIFKGIILFFELLGRLPLNCLYFFGNLSVLIDYIPLNPLKSLIGSNLKLIYPHISETELIKLRKATYFQMGCYVAEFVKTLRDNNAIKLKIRDTDILRKSLQEYRITFCLSGHFCGFELLTNILSDIDNLKVVLVYEQGDYPNMLDNWIKEKRSRGGAVLVPSDNCYRYISKLIKEESNQHILIGALCDLLPHKMKNCVEEVYFFGKKRAMYNGMARIGNKIGANFLYVDVSLLTKGHYSIKFRKLMKNRNGVDTVTQEYAKFLSVNIKHSPTLWMPIVLDKM